MTQVSVPNSDITVTGWSTSASLPAVYQAIDSGAGGTDGDARVDGPGSAGLFGLSAVTDPNVSTGHVLTVRASSSGGGAAEKITYDLMQGTTLIASSGATNLSRSGFTTLSFTLTATQADSITDYSALRVRLTPTLGSGETMFVDYVTFEVPDVVVGFSGSVSLSGSGTLTVPTRVPRPTQTSTPNGSGTLTATGVPAVVGQLTPLTSSEQHPNSNFDANLTLAANPTIGNVIGQSFSPTVNFTAAQVGLMAKRTGALTHTVGIDFEIRSGSMTGTVIGQGIIAASATQPESTVLSATTPFSYGNLLTPVALSAGTTYYLKFINNEGSASGNDYYIGSDDTSSTYPRGDLLTFFNSTWTVRSGRDLLFAVASTEVAGGLSGSGTLTATGEAVFNSFSGTAALSGAGTTSATGVPAISRTVALSGGTTLPANQSNGLYFRENGKVLPFRDFGAATYTLTGQASRSGNVFNFVSATGAYRWGRFDSVELAAGDDGTLIFEFSEIALGSTDYVSLWFNLSNDGDLNQRYLEFSMGSADAVYYRHKQAAETMTQVDLPYVAQDVRYVKFSQSNGAAARIYLSFRSQPGWLQVWEDLDFLNTGLASKLGLYGETEEPTSTLSATLIPSDLTWTSGSGTLTATGVPAISRSVALSGAGSLFHADRSIVAFADDCSAPPDASVWQGSDSGNNTISYSAGRLDIAFGQWGWYSRSLQPDQFGWFRPGDVVYFQTGRSAGVRASFEIATRGSEYYLGIELFPDVVSVYDTNGSVDVITPAVLASEWWRIRRTSDSVVVETRLSGVWTEQVTRAVAQSLDQLWTISNIYADCWAIGTGQWVWFDNINVVPTESHTGTATLSGSGTLTLTGKPGVGGAVDLSGTGYTRPSLASFWDDFSTTNRNAWSVFTGGPTPTVAITGGRAELTATDTNDWSEFTADQTYKVVEGEFYYFTFGKISAWPSNWQVVLGDVTIYNNSTTVLAVAGNSVAVTLPAQDSYQVRARLVGGTSYLDLWNGSAWVEQNSGTPLSYDQPLDVYVDRYGGSTLTGIWVDNLNVTPFDASGLGTLTLSGQQGTQNEVGSVTLAGAGTLSLAAVPKPTGTLGTSGSGTLSLSAIPTPKQTFSPSGAGTLTLSAAKPGISGSTALAGNGTFAGSGSASTAGSVSPTGSGTLSLAGSPATRGTGAFSGVGTINLDGSPKLTRSVALAGAGTLALSGAPSVARTLPLAGSGTFSTAVAALSITASSGLAGSGTLSFESAVAGQVQLNGSGALSTAASPQTTGTVAGAGAGTLTLSGSVLSTASFAGAGTLVSSGRPSTSGAVATSGAGTLTLAGKPAVSGAAPTSGNGTLTLSGVTKIITTLPLSGSGTLTLSSAVATTGALGLSGSGTLSGVSPAVATSGALTLSGDGVLAGTQVGQSASGIAAVSGTGTLTLSASGTGFGSLTLAGAGALAGVVTALSTGDTDELAGSGTLGTVSAPGLTGTAALTSSGTLSLAGTPSTRGTIASAGAGALSSTALVAVSGQSALSGAGTLTGAGAGSGFAQVTLSGAGTLVPQQSGQSVSGSVAFTGGSALATSATPSTTGTSTLSGAGALTETGRPSTSGAITSSGSGALTASGVAQPQGELASTGTGTLSASGTAHLVADDTLAGTGVLVLVGSAVTTSGSVVLGGVGTLALVAQANEYATGALNLTGFGELITRIADNQIAVRIIKTTAPTSAWSGTAPKSTLSTTAPHSNWTGSRPDNE